MFGISDSELLVILFILIVIVGPRRLPEIAKELTKFYRVFIKAYEQAKNDIKQNIDIDNEYVEDFKKIRDLKKFTNFKDLNPTEKIRNQWKDLLEEAKAQEKDNNQKTKENNSNEERPK